MEPISGTQTSYLGVNNISRLVAAYGLVDPYVAVQIPQIDFSKDNIVIWVPGTGMDYIPNQVRSTIRSRLGSNVSLVNAEYLANWKFLSSMPHGQKTLMEILDYVALKKKKNTKVYLIGLSQGAMIVSDTLSVQKYYSLVDRAVLFGHPSIAGAHEDTLGSLKVKEFNNFLDPATFDWKGNHLKIIKSIDSVFRGDILDGLYLLKVAAKNPSEALILATAGLKYLPFYNSNVEAFGAHNYTNSYGSGVRWLLSAD